MQQYQLADYFDNKTLSDFTSYLENMEWNYGIPGGFLTNQPQRKVMAFGDGSKINIEGELISDGWKQTYWTAKMNQNNVTLETETEIMPSPLRKLIPGLRKLFSNTFPTANTNDNTFTIGVCNYYTDPNMNIAAHTDDNIWYPRECEEGPVFASITLYPKGIPEELDAYSRFQIKQDGKWQTIHLKHESVLIMPSNIEHRVLAHTKKMQSKFKPRINITFRSVYPIDINPLMNAMAVANHTRYYRIPKALYIPYDLEESRLIEIWDAFNQLALAHKKTEVMCFERTINNTTFKTQEKEKYQRFNNQFNSVNFTSVKFTSNMVPELIAMVNTYLND